MTCEAASGFASTTNLTGVISAPINLPGADTICVGSSGFWTQRAGPGYHDAIASVTR